MEKLADKLFVQNKLKPFFVTYVIFLAVFLCLLSGAVLFTRYTASLEETLSKFQVIKVNLAKIRNLTDGTRGTLNEAAKVIPSDVAKEDPATQMYRGLDALRSHMGKAQVAATVIEDRGNELAMAVTITGPIADYQAFLNSIGRAQSMSFPFFAITNLTMVRDVTEDGKPTFSFDMRGTLTTPKAESGPEQTGPGRRKS